MSDKNVKLMSYIILNPRLAEKKAEGKNEPSFRVGDTSWATAHQHKGKIVDIVGCGDDWDPWIPVVLLKYAREDMAYEEINAEYDPSHDDDGPTIVEKAIHRNVIFSLLQRMARHYSE